MDEWRERLAGIDDDYLIGISNKGIVKRAYKDMEGTAAEIGTMGDEATVKVGAETVTVRFPLGESKCTCPSRSICRHVVHAILILREACTKGGTDRLGQDAAEELPTETGSAEGTYEEGDALQKPGSSPGDCPVQEAARNIESRPAQETDSGQNAPQEIDNLPGQGDIPNPGRTEGRRQDQRTEGSPDSAVWKEINGYPFEKLKKALGSRYFQSFANQAATGIRPQIQTSSVVTVHLLEQGMVVKLLSPLEYSTCTCHKKELCRHKAAAILWCQMEAGSLTREALRKEIADTPAYDLEEVRDVAGQMEGFLEELMGTGLSRVSPEATDYLERLAIISHNAQLARFEGYFRALSDSYCRYFARKAAFRTEDLLEQLTRLYRRAQLLRQATGQEAVGELAGEFRADYLPVGNLDLIGIAMEHFQSQTGYEGETIYFLEENTKQWYTYTNARPMFYDGSQGRGRGQSRQGASPWGLNISFENLLKVRIHLTGAKCDGRGRLSSSQETKGEITGERGLGITDLGTWYYRDFAELFRRQIGRQQRNWLARQSGFAETGDQEETGQKDTEEKGAELVFVQPDACAKAEFSQTTQQLTLPLYDRAGRELLVEVTYSRQESGTIRYLERISQKRLPCFLGKVYLREGRLRMYPVDLLDLEESGDDAGGNGLVGEQGSAPEEQTAAENLENREGTAAAIPTDHKPKFLVMEDMAREVLSLMADLCQSGFSTVHDSTLRGLRAAAALAAQYGMEHLSGMLAALEEKLAAGRHRMEQENGPLAGIYTDINEYLYLLRQKNEYCRGESYYT